MGATDQASVSRLHPRYTNIYLQLYVGLVSFLFIRLKKNRGASLVAQWLGIRLPMQGTRVRALVWEDPTCRGATRPVSHNY